ncbi:putative hydrolase of the HAD superfamily [Streptoalloteichus tenebrarius]|uniref:Hydrolase of the HAD superfamily n=1 Tax=Streptoalloteichus tenebrarius (strain ATCC 17920 / DSM 40477 / JCM 4838 / CBS 697.72 / NBRC 16177 / NCIMB 11028 / NRRL B-12390 / A12253. 1 / ISP 5477) TaxID=1933 RepID=A0ABT1HPU3_STRSD|nr:HAD-IA family hydrolase [Streptoalloteichus tenebrarius]MCP2257535.1 putative hydrolase of the HAD superfamily [Streptoalloteichus tenebrarius]
MGDERHALVLDYGGVLTTSVATSVHQWLTSDGIEPASYHAALREWYDSASQDSPVHGLENGTLPPGEFERLLAARLRTGDGRPVPAEGLLTRMFAGMRPDEEMLRLVRAARAAGLATALLSNSWGNTYPTELLAELFDVVVISGEVGLRKPDAAIYTLLVERLALPARRCVFVDDLPFNVEAAVAVGMTGLHHVDAATTRGELARLLPALAEVTW